MTYALTSAAVGVTAAAGAGRWKYEGLEVQAASGERDKEYQEIPAANGGLAISVWLCHGW